MKLRGLVITNAGVERHLTWLGEPTEPPDARPEGEHDARKLGHRRDEPARGVTAAVDYPGQDAE